MQELGHVHTELLEKKFHAALSLITYRKAQRLTSIVVKKRLYIISVGCVVMMIKVDKLYFTLSRKYEYRNALTALVRLEAVCLPALITFCFASRFTIKWSQTLHFADNLLILQ